MIMSNEQRRVTRRLKYKQLKNAGVDSKRANNMKSLKQSSIDCICTIYTLYRKTRDDELLKVVGKTYD